MSTLLLNENITVMQDHTVLQYSGTKTFRVIKSQHSTRKMAALACFSAT